jgi:putative ABC transport system ATP-binding protein
MISVKNLSKTYQLGKENFVHALNDVSFEIEKSSINAIVGPSGSGKSTLLNIMGGLDRDYEGTVKIDDRDLKKISANNYRRNYVQTIFQQFYLIPALDVYENITLPIKFGRQMSKKKIKERADYILNKVGLFDRKHHRQSELSGGQIQRVAIARALMPNPKIILADEPTGNLDTKTGNQIMDLLFEINKEEGTTLAIITHDMEVIKDVKNVISIRDGKITN